MDNERNILVDNIRWIYSINGRNGYGRSHNEIMAKTLHKFFYDEWQKEIKEYQKYLKKQINKIVKEELKKYNAKPKLHRRS